MTENNNFLFNFEKKIFVWEITFIVLPLSVSTIRGMERYKNLRLPRDHFNEVLPR